MAEMTFRIVPAESQVTFLAESSLHPIEVRATPQGWFVARLSDAGIIDGEGAAGHLEIPVSDLSSGNPLLDRETKRRTNAKDHPFIIGDLTTVLAVDDAEADIEGRIAFRGEEVDVEGRIELTSIL